MYERAVCLLIRYCSAPGPVHECRSRSRALGIVCVRASQVYCASCANIFNYLQAYLKRTKLTYVRCNDTSEPPNREKKKKKDTIYQIVPLYIHKSKPGKCRFLYFFFLFHTSCKAPMLTLSTSIKPLCLPSPCYRCRERVELYGAEYPREKAISGICLRLANNN